ncbi:hypothetical protein HAX54_028154 [Datura stramonium]|uniref:Uncharacterized protein n=1 Tax=Datura stramonium TaxID=4076 RepID=A0ABS8V3L6_DATST|nr:hypothetical protein [Datura stramonium]
MGQKDQEETNEEKHDDVSLPQQPLRVGPGFEEPLDDDVATDEEMERVDSDIESDEEEEDSGMREAALALTDDED